MSHEYMLRAWNGKVSLIWLCALTSSIAQADQERTCILEGREHEAHYHCPNGFEAIVAGENTKKCDGACYQRGNQNSLEMAISMILRSRGLQISGTEISQIADELEHRGTVTFQGIAIKK